MTAGLSPSSSVDRCNAMLCPIACSLASFTAPLPSPRVLVVTLDRTGVWPLIGQHDTLTDGRTDRRAECRNALLRCIVGSLAVAAIETAHRRTEINIGLKNSFLGRDFHAIRFQSKIRCYVQRTVTCDSVTCYRCRHLIGRQIMTSPTTAACSSSPAEPCVALKFVAILRLSA